MIVAMLAALRPVCQQAAVFLDISDDLLVALEPQAAFAVLLNFYACLAVKARRPALLRFRRGKSVNPPKNLARLQTQYILFGLGQHR